MRLAEHVDVSCPCFSISCCRTALRIKIDGAGRKAGLTGSVLGMEVGRGQEQLVVWAPVCRPRRATLAPVFRCVATYTVATLGKPIIALCCLSPRGAVDHPRCQQDKYM